MRKLDNDNSELKFDTPAGTIIGWEDALVLRAGGIPYAYAEQFGEPKPIPYFEEPFSAKTKSPAPPQLPAPMTNKIVGFDMLDGLNAEEHCQYLSITLPKNINRTDRLPVMIWVFGGGYVGAPAIL